MNRDVRSEQIPFVQIGSISEGRQVLTDQKRDSGTSPSQIAFWVSLVSLAIQMMKPTIHASHTVELLSLGGASSDGPSVNRTGMGGPAHHADGVIGP
jgi:hypothetical protein